MVDPGAVFFTPNAGQIRRHLYIVISDPTIDPRRVYLVNVTSKKGHEPPEDLACEISPGEDNRIPVPSYVTYAYWEFSSVEKLESQESQQVLQRSKPVSPDLLRRVREGFLRSEHLSKNVKDDFRKRIPG